MFIVGYKNAVIARTANFGQIQANMTCYGSTKAPLKASDNSTRQFAYLMIYDHHRMTLGAGRVLV
jgi:hypothetical protein